MCIRDRPWAFASAASISARSSGLIALRAKARCWPSPCSRRCEIIDWFSHRRVVNYGNSIARLEHPRNCGRSCLITAARSLLMGIAPSKSTLCTQSRRCFDGATPLKMILLWGLTAHTAPAGHSSECLPRFFLVSGSALSNDYNFRCIFCQRSWQKMHLNSVLMFTTQSVNS